MILAETVGPYTIGLAVVMLAGIPIAARYIKKAVTLEGFGMRAEIGEVKEDIRVAAQAASIAAESVGSKNGEGSLQEQVLTISNYIDEERQKREEGQHRQAHIAETVSNIQDMIVTMRNMLDTHAAWQTAHGEEDMRLFQKLQASCNHLQGLLGEPIDGVMAEPLIPYVHRLKHELANQETRNIMLTELQNKVLVDAISIIKDAKDKMGLNGET